MSNLPVVAIVGAPNVGKSTLLNRVLGRRQAVVSATAGTTRDRSYNRAEWAGHEFTLVDTGGMEPRAKVGLETLVTLQAKVAVEDPVTAGGLSVIRVSGGILSISLCNAWSRSQGKRSRIR